MPIYNWIMDFLLSSSRSFSLLKCIHWVSSSSSLPLHQLREQETSSTGDTGSALVLGLLHSASVLSSSVCSILATQLRWRFILSNKSHQRACPLMKSFSEIYLGICKANKVPIMLGTPLYWNLMLFSKIYVNIKILQCKCSLPPPPTLSVLHTHIKGAPYVPSETSLGKQKCWTYHTAPLWEDICQFSPWQWDFSHPQDMQMTFFICSFYVIWIIFSYRSESCQKLTIWGFGI